MFAGDESKRVGADYQYLLVGGQDRRPDGGSRLYGVKRGHDGAYFSLAREAAGQGVTANGISPAYINTPMVTEQLTEAQRNELLSSIPVGRFCEAGEVAHVVAFLASPLSGFITGEVIDVNGGLHLD